MNAAKKILAVYIILVICFSAYVFANQVTTTMTWYIPSVKSHSITYGQTCNATAFFFPETKATLDSDSDGNASQILPYTDRAGTTACQSNVLAGMLIENDGTATTNIDANFAAALDTNVWLKVWKGNDSGCGTSGLGGWTLICSLTNSATTPVTTTACKDFNSANATTATRLISNLEAGDTNQLCYSGELRDAYLHLYPAKVTGGVDHNASFRTSTEDPAV